LDFVVCPEEPALYFNEGVALRNLPSISTRGLLPDPAGFYLTVSPFLPRRTSYLPLPSSGRCLRLILSRRFLSRFVSSLCLVTLSCRFVLSLCLVVLSRRFVSSLQCLVVWIRFCLRQAAVLSRLVLSRRFVSSLQCLVVWIQCCLRQAVVLPPLGRRISLFSLSLLFCYLDRIAISVISVVPPTHPTRLQSPREGEGGRGTFGTGTCLGGGRG
jgi:hypothetical protein